MRALRRDPHRPGGEARGARRQVQPVKPHLSRLKPRKRRPPSPKVHPKASARVSVPATFSSSPDFQVALKEPRRIELRELDRHPVGSETVHVASVRGKRLFLGRAPDLPRPRSVGAVDHVAAVGRECGTELVRRRRRDGHGCAAVDRDREEVGVPLGPRIEDDGASIGRPGGSSHLRASETRQFSRARSRRVAHPDLGVPDRLEMKAIRLESGKRAGSRSSCVDVRNGVGAASTEPSARASISESRRRSSGRGSPRREVALARVKDDLSKYLRLAAREEIVITRHGRPAGVLIGFGSDDLLDYPGASSGVSPSHRGGPRSVTARPGSPVGGCRGFGKSDLRSSLSRAVTFSSQSVMLCRWLEARSRSIPGLGQTLGTVAGSRCSRCAAGAVGSCPLSYLE